jgi:hypothetical protein
MKHIAACLMLVVGAVLVAGTGVEAGGKEKTIKGTITCAKCDLKVEGVKKCATVIVAKKGDKETVYYFDTAGHKKYHGDVCTTPKKGSVTGTVTKKGDKYTITVKSLDYE